MNIKSAVFTSDIQHLYELGNLIDVTNVVTCYSCEL